MSDFDVDVTKAGASLRDASVLNHLFWGVVLFWSGLSVVDWFFGSLWEFGLGPSGWLRAEISQFGLIFLEWYVLGS